LPQSGGIRVFALTHSRRIVFNDALWLISFSLGVIAYDRSTTSSLRIDTAIAGYLCSSDVELRVWAG
jgi:hypothetical protein